jgi:hypothetical protein
VRAPRAAAALLASTLAWAASPATGGSPASPADDPAVPFTVVILPDTQNYASSFPHIFTAQTRWIVENRDAENIVMVLHEGDITNDNGAAQWANADASLGLLDGVVPYLLVPGNHDTGPGGRAEVRDTAAFNATFPLSRFSSRPEFVEAMEPDRLDNHAQRFRAGGTDWLVVGLEFGPRDAALAWARDVIARHPSRRVMLVTHTSLYFDDTLHGTSPYHSWTPHRYPLARARGDVNDGVEIWEKLGRRHPNVSFVFNGHVLDDGAARLGTVGDYGHRVQHLLANYQMRPSGGEGYLRLLRFDVAAGRVAVETYSPYLDRFLTDPQNAFTLDGLELGPPPADGRPHADAGPDLEGLDADGDGSASVLLDGSGSRGLGGTIVDWRWREGGRDVAQGEVAAATLPVGRHLLALTVTDDAGLSMDDAVRVDVHPAPVLLADRFGAPALGAWTVADDGTVGAPSAWRAVHGTLMQTSNVFGPDASATQGRLGTRCTWSGAGSEAWEDYTLSATLGTGDDDGIGVLFRAGASGYYKLDLDAQRAFRKLFRLKDGVETTLAVETTGFVPATDLPVRVHVRRSRIEVSLDGRPLFGGTVTDGGLPAGSVGLYTWGAEDSAFDDVAVASGCGIPWEVESLTVDDALVRWAIAPFADEYDVLRGTLAEVRLGRYGACVSDRDPDLKDRAFSDLDAPAPGLGFTYLVRGRSVLCAGTGGFGRSSAGTERAPDAGGSCP